MIEFDISAVMARVNKENVKAVKEVNTVIWTSKMGGKGDSWQGKPYKQLHKVMSLRQFWIRVLGNKGKKRRSFLDG